MEGTEKREVCIRIYDSSLYYPDEDEVWEFYIKTYEPVK